MYSEKILDDIDFIEKIFLRHTLKEKVNRIRELKYNEFMMLEKLPKEILKLDEVKYATNKAKDDIRFCEFIKGNENIVRVLNSNEHLYESINLLYHVKDMDVIKRIALFLEEQKIDDNETCRVIIEFILTYEIYINKLGLNELVKYDNYNDSILSLIIEKMKIRRSYDKTIYSIDSDRRRTKNHKIDMVNILKFIKKYKLVSMEKERVYKLSKLYYAIKSNYDEDEANNAILYYKDMIDMGYEDIKIEYDNYIAMTKEFNIKERLDIYKEIRVYIECKNIVNKIFKELEINKFSNKEMKTYLYKIKENENDIEGYTFGLSKNWYNSHMLCNKILAFIYPNMESYKNISEVTKNEYPNGLKLMLRNKKKNILNIVNSLKDKRNIIDLLGYKGVWERLILGDLLKEDFDRINKILYGNSYSYSSPIDKIKKIGTRINEIYDISNKKISAKELTFIAGLVDEKYEIYLKILDKKLEEKIKIIMELPDSIENYEIESIVNIVKEIPVSSIISNVCKNTDIDKRDYSKREWLDLILFEKFDLYKEQIKNKDDVDFIIRYMNILSNNNDVLNLKEHKLNVLKKSKEYERFIKSMDLNDEFIERYKDSMYSFGLRGLMEKYLRYMNSLNKKDVMVNFKRITKAHLMNRIDDIKFGNNDLSKEIEFDIDLDTEDKWKENIKSSNDKYELEERYDYETVLNLGVIPVSTCMNYRNGCYNYCLMSNFDANKKILVIKEEGKIVARAILRLTKISDIDLGFNSKSSKAGLYFRDLEDEDNVEEKKNSKEELVLFLERTYTFKNEVNEIKSNLISLAMLKAESMGVRLVLSQNYNSIENTKYEEEKVNGYITITVSKNNGYQYVDSFGGAYINKQTESVDITGCKILNSINSQKERYIREIEYSLN